MSAPQPKNDGIWHAIRARQTSEKGTRWVGHLDQYRDTSTNVVRFTRRGWKGVVARFVGYDTPSTHGRAAHDRREVKGGWQFDDCGHCHAKQSAADKCAERYARNLNRKP